MAKDNTSGPLNVQRLTAVDLCALLLKSGVKHLTPSEIGKWVNIGCPRNRDKTYSLPAVTAWLINDRAERPHRPPAETDEMEKAKLARMHAQTRRTELATAREQKEVISREEVDEDQSRKIHAVRSGMLTLVRVIGREIEGKSTREITTIINQRIVDLLEAYSSGWDGATVEIPKREGWTDVENRKKDDAAGV